MITKNKQLDMELENYKSELENANKKHYDLHQKYIYIQQLSESDACYIDKLKEEIIRDKTNLQVLSNECEILAKINEELSVDLHLKENEIINLKSQIELSGDYKYAIEMNVSFEQRLKTYENEITSLKLQIQQKNQEIHYLEKEKASCKESIAKSNGCDSDKAPGNIMTAEEIRNIIKDFNVVILKYKKCKEKKMRLVETNEILKEKIKGVSSQVLSDHYLILHLQDKLRGLETPMKDPRENEDFTEKINSEDEDRIKKAKCSS